MKESRIYCLDKVNWSGFEPEAGLKATASLSLGEDRLFVSFTANHSVLNTKRTEDDSDVWCDSTVEFFFSPVSGKYGYLNFEMTAKGVLFVGYNYGSTRASKEQVPKFLWKRSDFNIKAMNQSEIDLYNSDTSASKSWSLSYEIPFSFIRKIFPEFSAPSSLSELRGNFYLCEDDADKPYYVTAFPIGEPEPNYHCPKYFAKL